MTRGRRTTWILLGAALLVAAAAFLGRPDRDGADEGAAARTEDGSTAPSRATPPPTPSSGWWDRLLRRIGLPGSGPGLRGGGEGGDDSDSDDSDRPLWRHPVEGIVVDGDGAPVAGAEVRRISKFRDRPSPDRVRSGPDGLFRIDVKTDSPADVLEARDRGRRSRHVRADTTPLRLQLLAEARLEIVVRDARTREPVPGAEVAARGLGTSEEPGVRSTDVRGRAVVEASPATSYVVRVGATGYAPALARVTSVPGETHVVAVDVGRGAVLRGTVQDHLGHAVAGARLDLMIRLDNLDLWDLRPRRDLETTTDSQGRFEFPHVPTGLPLHSLGAKAPDGRTTSLVVRALAEGEERSLDVRLPEPIRISGRLVRVDGSPVRDGTIRIEDLRGYSDGPQTRPDEAGEFAFESVPPGAGWLAVDDPSGEEVRRISLHLERGGPQHLTVVVPPRVEDEPAREVDVRVLDARGAPVLRATVGTGSLTSTTNSLGIASVPVGDARSVELRVRPPEGLEQVRAVAVPANGPIEFRLADGVVAGRIVRHDGTPSRSTLVLRARREGATLVEAVLVGMGLPREDPKAAAMADASGAFRFGGVGDGEYVLAYREADDHPWLSRVVRAGEVQLTLQIPPPSDLLRSFEVEVLDEVGAPVAGSLVGLELTGRDGPAWSGVLLAVGDRPGVYRSTPGTASAALSAGLYDVTVHPGIGYLDERMADQRIAGGVHRWTVRRRPANRVEGVVRSRDGRAVSGAILQAGPVGWQADHDRPARFGLTDVDGRYELLGVAPGPLEVAVRPPGWAWATRTLEVGEDRVTRLDFELEEGGSIEVWPVDGRAPPDGAQVVLRRLGAETTFERAETANDERGEPWAELRGVQPGRVVLAVVLAEREVFRAEVAVRAGETSVVAVPP